ncbi:hypothetical protein CEV32_1558 [Brucella rhizosphaerae]|uniref:Uncharacterized protein n=1 Tax=Brucella rhizosphaerae TaxID=571254 RepID=A0A256F949_9HYPH|nr:hypothetical protein CEV32_1558 [Brucella rhizosphaerae]
MLAAVRQPPSITHQILDQFNSALKSSDHSLLFVLGIRQTCFICFFYA